MWTAIRQWLFVIYWLFFLTAQVCAQAPPECDDRAWVVLHPQAGGPVPVFQTTPGSSLPMQLYLPDFGVELCCLGYSTRNHIYGLDPENFHLYRIDETGAITNLGYPNGLDTSYVYRAGTMAPDGVRMVLIGHDTLLGRDREFFSILVHLPGMPVGSTSIVSEDEVKIGDIAFDPWFGNAYGFDEIHQRLVNIGWPGGLITSFNYEKLSDVTAMGSLFFDSNGVLYGYGSKSSNAVETTLFTLNKVNGSIIDSQGGPAGLDSDGCSCPYRIFFDRIVSDTVLLPCQEFKVTYAMRNRAGLVYQDITLTDLLPPGFEITAIDQIPYPGDFSQGIGDNALSYDEFDLLIGLDTLIVRIRAPQEPGTAYMQAMLDPFPAAFGFSISSDDPFRSGTADPNVVRIIGDGEIFPESETFLCPGSTIRLETGLEEGDFLWSDGSTEPWLDVQFPGEYWLEVSGACGVYRDTVTVTLLPEPLEVDLGPDLDIRIGDYFTPDVQTNAGYPLTYAWMSDGVSFDCVSCMVPVVGPLINDSRIILTVRNEAYGCLATDSLFIHVLKDRAVYLPNIFSPDFNGINDRFYPQSLEAAEILRFQVFDRWGKQVFSGAEGMTGDPAIGWDGHFQGRPLPSGTYLWLLELEFLDGWKQEMYGDITLIR